jgi:hypothetical protein
MASPTAIWLFTYRVGFGDCFLLRFEYGAKARHVLVDFGSTAPASKAIGNQMLDVAKDVAERCQGRLDAIVATHRHRDHVSAFAGRTWKVIERLRPRLAVLPWTEHPDAATDATVAPTGTKGRIGARSSAHVRSLSDMQAVAAAALRELRRRGGAPPTPTDDDTDPFAEAFADAPEAPWAREDPGPPPIGRPFGKGLAREIAFLGDDNLGNAEAMKNLLSLPALDFVCFGSRTRLEKLLPGVGVRVLGPPTLAQTEAIRGQRSRDPDEFWHVMALAGSRAARAGAGALFPKVKTVNPRGLPFETRWFLKRLDGVRAGELLEIVRVLDEAMNNTSVILLFEALGKKMLFPGDAQIESWSYALADTATRELLAGVDVYKVGHHGSLNATPRTLWGLFAKRGGPRSARLKTFVSTRAGKHGSPSRGTEVPRKKLVEALEAESDLFSTQQLRAKKDFVQAEQIA